MSTQDTTGPAGDERVEGEDVNVVRLVGRLSAPAEGACCRAATRCARSAWWSGAPGSPPSSGSTRWSAPVGRACAVGAAWRPATSSRSRAPCGAVLPHAGGRPRGSRWRSGPVGGYAVQRADEHARLGLGWKDVAFSGSRRPRLITRTTSKSGAGISTAAVGRSRGRAPRRPSGGTRAAGGRCGSRSACSPSTGRPALRDVRSPTLAVGGDEGVLRQRAERGPGRGTGVDAGAAAAAHARPQVERAAQGPVDRAQEQRRDGLVDQHRETAVAGLRGLLLHPQVGRVPVVAVGDQGARAGQAALARRCSRGRGSPRRGGAGRRGRRTRGAVARRRTRSTSHARSAGPRCTRRMGAGLICQVVIRSASSSTWSGWMPSCGTPPGRRPRSPGGRCRGPRRARAR